ncbi:MAG: phospho-sugar mutase [Firmicutes bacterium]|nr:phospho-sugar mutase [Bacillota bacterium]
MTIERWERQLNKWLEAEELDAALRRELQELSERKDHKARRELEERFYKNLEFGTSGLRGHLGAGTNRLNVHTVRWIMQGICDYIAEDLGAFDGVDIFTRTLVKPENLESAPAVAIAFDSRNFSRDFAQAAAEVLVANGVKAYMFSEIVPVATLSFAVRKFGCLAGVVMTASHNPADYNGVKVYNSEGCQVMPGEQKKMYARMKALDIFSDVSYLNFEKAKLTPYFEELGDEVIEEYIESVLAERVVMDGEEESAFGAKNESGAKSAFGALKVLYTPLNGGGMRPACEMMKRLGIEKLEIVKSQEKPDGNFTTCPSPNPELDETYEEALEIARTSRPDVIIATDPDCDRFGVVVKMENGMYRKLSGNETGIIILDYIIRAKKSGICDTQEPASGNARFELASGNGMPGRPVAVRSLTASALADVIARENGVEIMVIPNGSNYIGETVSRLADSGRSGDFLFAFEDTNQCLSGTYTRDEDGVLGAMHILSAAAEAKAMGKNLCDLLEDIYEKYGYFVTDSASIAFHGIEGLKKRDEIMAGLRKTAEAWKSGAEDKGSEVEKEDGAESGFTGNKIGGNEVEEIKDYMAGDCGLPKLDAIEIRLSGDAGVTIRPSGTEPKLKLYMHAKGKSAESARLRCGEIERDIIRIVNS